MTTHEKPVANAAMLIRKPVAEVFDAFVDPAVTTKFWFTKGTGRLDQGKRVQWIWEMYAFTVNVNVKVIDPNKRIVIEWGGPDDPSTVEWTFTARPDNTTFVDVTNFGFRGDDEAIVKQALDSTGGFALVLAGLKAWLEHGIQLNLVPDRFPRD